MSDPLAFLVGHKPPVAMSPDLRRILNLPRRPRVEPGSATELALINHVTARYSRGPRACRCAEIQRSRHMRPKPCILQLNGPQSWALHEISLVAGLVGQIAVGGGKTVIGLLTPLAMPGCQCAVMLVPSTLVTQLVNEYDLLAEHFHVPQLIVHAGADSPRPRFVANMPVLHVLPYSRFQRATSTVFLEKMNPDTLIVDEAQNLANLLSTRSGRFIRYFGTHARTRLCAWSGTLTDDEIEDYVHLCGLALREGSPVPLDPDEAESWGEAINPDDWVAPAGALKLLCRDENEHVQDAFHRRLVETLGFVSTSGASISTPLEILERHPPPVPPDIAEHLGKLRATWIRPDGEELIDALSVARCARELACGLYLRWRFVNGETVQLIERWLLARKLWRRELRDKLMRREPFLDSPMLCANAAMRAWGMTGPVTDMDEHGRVITQAERHDLPTWRAETWPEWHAVKGLVKPLTEAVRVNNFLALDAAAWAHENRGIVWYKTVAFGQWIAELSGLPMHGGGPKAGEKIAQEDGSRSIIASIASHGTGRDGLQRLFSTQHVTQPPSSAVAFEQLFGRLSRIGQDADIVRAFIYRHTPEVRACVDDALRKAQYVQRTMGAPQKLIAGWTPSGE